MGVDWYACGICGETFCDCGPYGFCSECETRLCSHCHNEQVEKYGNPSRGSHKESWYGENSSDKCDLCSNTIVRDSDIIEYLLEKVKMTRDDVVKHIEQNRNL